MTEKTRKIPMGIEDFERIRTEEFYYIDKTGLIRDCLKNLSYVNLFTRPRRFGKTLNMSMLKYFFEIGSDSTLFDGLEISKENTLCDEYMGKFPVVSITHKDVCGKNFKEAIEMLRGVIAKEALKFSFLMHSDKLTGIEYKQYKSLIDVDDRGDYIMSDSLLSDSLLLLSQFLQKHYEKKVIILIDEYDVPLDKAYQSGYYDEMVDFIRWTFGKAFKTNNSMEFAVLTGCLRISKESNVSANAETSEKRSKRFSQASPKGDVLFTGLNNFKVYTINDVLCNEYFGFTDEEIRELLSYYGFMDHYDAIKEWYDGYQFGNLHIYCPWDVINHQYS